MVSWEIRFTSRTPCSTSCRTSVTTSATVRERCLPRISGMTQNEQVRLHPSAIFTYALPPGVERARGLAAPTSQSAGLPTSMRSARPESTWASLSMSLDPRKWSTSGISRASSSGWRCERQPDTTRRRQRPLPLSSAISRMASIDSFFASPMKPQVLTTITSASAASSTCAKPASRATPSMTSESTRFLGQPRLTKWMVCGPSGAGVPAVRPFRGAVVLTARGSSLSAHGSNPLTRGRRPRARRPASSAPRRSASCRARACCGSWSGAAPGRRG